MRAVSSVLFVRTAVNLVSSNGFRVSDEFLVFLDAECLSVSGCVTFGRLLPFLHCRLPLRVNDLQNRLLDEAFEFERALQCDARACSRASAAGSMRTSGNR